MLIKKEHFFKCPSCGVNIQKELWNIADARLFPDVNKEILDGKFNIVLCSKCKVEFYAEVPFVYQDIDKKLFITVFPEIMKKDGFKIRKQLNSVKDEKNLNKDLKDMIFFGIGSLVEFLKMVEK
ncbi:MAG: CpXC domain-containing protein [Candidatus Muirbacterium halophilum]|nr:CpXC domain-containing protein [Candidatus Muirbacterium halophilum]